MLQNKPYDVLNGTPFTKFEGLPGANLYLVHTKSEFESFFEMLMSKKLVACDTETSGFQYFLSDRIVGMSFGWGDDNFYLPVRHVDSALGKEQPAQLDMDWVRPFLQKFFSRTDVQTIWSNFKFDRHFYKADSIQIMTPFHDTTILWQFYDENAPAALKTIASGWTDELGRKQKGLIGPEAAEFEKELDKWRAEEAKERRRLFSQAVIRETENRAYDIKYQGIKRAALKKQVKSDLTLTHPYAKAKKEDVHYGYVPIDLMTKYAATDTFLTWAVFRFVLENVEFNAKLKALYQNELDLNTELFHAEEGGIKADRKHLENLRVKLKEDYANKKREILQILDPKHAAQAAAVPVSGTSEWDILEEEKPKDILSVVEEDLDKDTSLNLNSTDQLAIALQTQGIELTKRTESGKLCLDKKILTKLAKNHPVIQTILDLRAIVKKQNTYVEGILEKLTADDYLHASFNQNVSTGRMSSNSPNLQNISNKDDDIRAAFIPEEDYIFLFCDYSQIEVRLTAHYSKDPLLLDAYAKGQDVHTRTMCEMFGFSYEEVEQVLEIQDKSDPRFPNYKSLRGVAKCVHPSTILRDPLTGRLFRMDDLAFSSKDEEFLDIIGTHVVGKSGKPTQVTATFNGGNKHQCAVVTNRGVLVSTGRHRYVLADGSLKQASELTPGLQLEEPIIGEVGASFSYPMISWKPHKDCPTSTFVPNNEFSYIAGAFMGDGSVTGHTLSITHGHNAKKDSLGVAYQEWQNILMNSCVAAGLSPVSRPRSVYLGSNHTIRFFETMGLVDSSRQLDPNSRKSFRVPSWVLSTGSEAISHFLAGLFDTDGCVSKRGILSVTTKSPILAGHICECLRYLGLQFTNELSYNKTYGKHYYRIRLSTSDSAYFLSYMKHPGKLMRLEAARGVHTTPLKVPHKVLAVLPMGVLPCVDLSVSAEDHLYVANGLLTHNTINFGIIYGVGAPGLSEQIKRPDKYANLSDEEWVAVCQDFIDNYLDKYRGVRRFINASQKLVSKQCYLTNQFGRVRHLPHAQATTILQDRTQFWREARAQRQGTNFLIQSEAADIFKTAVVRIGKFLREGGYKSRIVNFVHDEIQIYLHKSELHLINDIKHFMEDFDYAVPIIADIEFSTTNWANKKEIH